MKLWTLTILTIPSRERYLNNLIKSIINSVDSSEIKVDIIGNQKKTNRFHCMLKRAVKTLSNEGIESRILFNNTGDFRYTVGRKFALEQITTPFTIFLDDDVTINGRLLEPLKETFQNSSAAMVGLRSFINNTNIPFKPYDEEPCYVHNDIVYMPLIGLLVAGYTALLKKFKLFEHGSWYGAEWAFVNTLAMRQGLAPAMNFHTHTYLSHWLDAPDSPTRNHKDMKVMQIRSMLQAVFELGLFPNRRESKVYWTIVEKYYLPRVFGPQTIEEGNKLFYEICHYLSIKQKDVFENTYRARKKLIEFLDRKFDSNFIKNEGRIIIDCAVLYIQEFGEKAIKRKEQFNNLPLMIYPFENLTKEKAERMIEMSEEHVKKFRKYLL